MDLIWLNLHKNLVVHEIRQLAMHQELDGYFRKIIVSNT